MYIDANFIIRAAAVVTALCTLWAFIYKMVKWAESQKQQETEIQTIKEEQCVMCYAILATLDGLKQLGANGNVTDAHEKLEKHLNKLAHDRK